jgi:TonB-linked SusC/RagA family outer membrane protein
MNKIKLKLFWCLLFTLITALTVSQTYAQETIAVKGTVLDGSNQPLIGVSVGINGTAGGTRTDINGNFQLTVPATAKSLKFSYIGFDTKTVAVATTMNIKMAAARNTLDDVVVIGYQSQKKKDVTGAVANISSKDFNQGNVTNSILQIQGKVAGVSIVQSTGDPNASPTIRLRGQTSLYKDQSPLIIVDGVQLVGGGDISNIPPGDIASYDVLKDASATSIYGSQGANGVIIITTKKGSAGKTLITYDGSVSVDNQSKFRNYLNADEALAATGQTAGSGSTYYPGGSGTDWQRAIIRPAYTQNNTLAISGGGKGFTYRGSVNYLDQQSIIINSGKEQLGIRFNGEQKALNDKLTVQIGIASSITNRKNLDDYVPNFVRNTSPGLPIYNADGTYNSFNYGSGQNLNRVETQNERTNSGKENLSQYSLSARYKITDDLTAGVVGTMSSFNNNKRQFRPAYGGGDNFADRNSNGNETYRGEFNLGYQKSIGKNNFSGIAVYENNYSTNNYFEASARKIPFNFLSDDLLQSGDQSTWKINSNRNEGKLVSVLSRVDYNYDNKYYVAGSVRRDGSSKFGPQNQWATFYSANVAWRITQENFMKDILWINDLKLRAGYGESGSQSALAENQFLQLFEAGPIQGGQQTYQIAQNANPDLRWERRQGRNVGLDFAFFNSRLSGDFNYFNDITKDLLFEYEDASLTPIPSKNNQPVVIANVGSLTNKGLELALNFQAITNKNFNWTIGGQISSVKTRIKSLQDPTGKYTLNNPEIPVSQRAGTYLTYLKEGYAPFVFQLPHFIGLNPDGTQNISTDKKYIDPSPKFNYGISNNFGYKNWSLSFFLRGVSGVKIYNAASAYLYGDPKKIITDGGNTTKEALEAGITGGEKVSDRWLENASFLRMDNASIGYTFKNIKNIQNLKVFVAANNVFVITKYTGLDPEVQTSSSKSDFGANSTNYLGIEESVPRTRSFSFGVNVTFQ